MYSYWLKIYILISLKVPFLEYFHEIRTCAKSHGRCVFVMAMSIIVSFSWINIVYNIVV